MLVNKQKNFSYPVFVLLVVAPAVIVVLVVSGLMLLIKPSAWLGVLVAFLAMITIIFSLRFMAYRLVAKLENRKG